MQQKELIYTILIKSTKQGIYAYCPDLNIKIYDKHHDISMLMNKVRNAINDLINEYNSNCIPIPDPTFHISDVPSGIIFFQAKIRHSPDMESITKQLYRIRLKAGITPRVGIFCKG